MVRREECGKDDEGGGVASREEEKGEEGGEEFAGTPEAPPTDDVITKPAHTHTHTHNFFICQSLTYTLKTCTHMYTHAHTHLLFQYITCTLACMYIRHVIDVENALAHTHTTH